MYYSDNNFNINSILKGTNGINSNRINSNRINSNRINSSINDYSVNDYSVNDYSVNDYSVNDYSVNEYGRNDYSINGYGRNSIDYSNTLFNNIPTIKQFRSINLNGNGIADDYYSNLIDWSNNILYYSVNNSVYSYNFYTEEYSLIYKCNLFITSLKHSKETNYLIIGTVVGAVCFIDIETLKVTKSLIHKSRIGVIKKLNYVNYVIQGNINNNKNLNRNGNGNTYSGISNSPSSINISPSSINIYSPSIDSPSSINSISPSSINSISPSFINSISTSSDCYTSCCIITGSRDRKTKITDIRTLETVITLSSHRQEVCGIAVSKLIATGGNDNKIFLYDLRSTKIPFGKITTHKAAIKALDWSLDNTKLASGGGSADKSIKIHSINNKNNKIKLIKSIQFDSQLTNIKWIGINSFVSTFGYCQNDIKIIKDYKVIKKFTGHKNRVIHFSMSDNRKYVVTGSSDGKIKFWNLGEHF